jgi:hypothetical protein
MATTRSHEILRKDFSDISTLSEEMERVKHSLSVSFPQLLCEDLMHESLTEPGIALQGLLASLNMIQQLHFSW